MESATKIVYISPGTNFPISLDDIVCNSVQDAVGFGIWNNIKTSIILRTINNESGLESSCRVR
jgi:hypothetical protein